jgi:predicted DNA-binding transcriptional regulator AlpA
LICVGELMRLASRGELAEMLGISRQRTRTLSQRSDFPTPIAVMRRGPVWRVEDLEAWAAKVGRTLRPLPEYDGRDG